MVVISSTQNTTCVSCPTAISWVYGRPNKWPWKASLCPLWEEETMVWPTPPPTPGLHASGKGQGDMQTDLETWPQTRKRGHLKMCCYNECFQSKLKLKFQNKAVYKDARLQKTKRRRHTVFSVQNAQYIKLYFFWRLKKNKSESGRKEKKKRKGELRGNKEGFQGFLCCLSLGFEIYLLLFVKASCRNFPSVDSKKLSSKYLILQALADYCEYANL